MLRSNGAPSKASASNAWDRPATILKIMHR